MAFFRFFASAAVPWSFCRAVSRAPCSPFASAVSLVTISCFFAIIAT